MAIPARGDLQFERLRDGDPVVFASESCLIVRRAGMMCGLCRDACPAAVLAGGQWSIALEGEGCVGCGLCGEVAHAAQLCPSFAQIDIIQNPTPWDRLRRRLSAALIRMLGGGRTDKPSLVPAE